MEVERLLSEDKREGEPVKMEKEGSEDGEMCSSGGGKNAEGKNLEPEPAVKQEEGDNEPLHKDETHESHFADQNPSSPEVKSPPSQPSFSPPPPPEPKEEPSPKTSAFSPPASIRLFQPFLPNSNPLPMVGGLGGGNGGHSTSGSSVGDGSPPPRERSPHEQQQQKQQQQQQQLHQRPAPPVPQLPFSIDNILQPSFGQSLFLHRVAAAAAAVATAQKNAAVAAAVAAAAAGEGPPPPVGAVGGAPNLFHLGKPNFHHPQPRIGGLPIVPPSPAFAAAAAHPHPPAPSSSSPSPSSPSPGLTLLGQDSIKREPVESPLSNGSEGGGTSNNNNGKRSLPSPSASSASGKPVDLSSKNGEADGSKEGGGGDKGKDGDCPPGMVRGPNGQLWPAWVFCTRYSDRPSSGPRLRKVKKEPRAPVDKSVPKDKRPRTAFNADQLGRLRREFEENRYLTEERRRTLATDLGLNENQIKIWFQNKRAKIKKTSGSKGELAQMLAAQGLYNHSTIPVDEDEYPNL